MSNPTFDVIIVGAGIVGLSVARELLQRKPATRIAILDKEPRAGMHASGRNSGVMHCGIYYGADTLKAKVCATGAARILEYAKAENIPYNQCGKVIITTKDSDLPTVDKLLANAKANNIQAERINNTRLHELEPNAAEVAGAIYCPTTAVIDSAAVLQRLQSQLTAAGVTFHFNCPVSIPADGSNRIETPHGTLSYGYLFNCAGAYADTIAKSFGLAADYALVPFKGIYWKLSKEANNKVRANIYPVPDINMPFLGVHLTRVISGDVYVGPTAIPALGRENYGLTSGIKLGEAAAVLSELGKMYLANPGGNFRHAAHIELGKYIKSNFLSAAQKLMPTLKAEDMVPTNKAGIRPQLVNVKTHKLEMDYIFESTEHSLHVLNAISPAFTSSFAFAEMIVDRSAISR